MSKIDLNKLGNLGLFLLGISGVITSSLLIYNTFFAGTQPVKPKPYLSAFCERANNQTVIVLRAYNGEFRNIKVYDLEGKLVCELNKVSDNYENVCVTNESGIFRITTDGVQKIVNCVYNYDIKEASPVERKIIVKE